MGVLPAVVALLISLALLVRFLAWERTGQRLSVVLWLLGLLLVEALVWPDPNDMPPGIVHPDIGPTNFRLLDTVALAALLAVVVGRGLPSRISTAAMWWTAFLAWLGLAAVRGALFGNDPVTIVFQAKVIGYLAVMAVAAGVRPADWRSPALDRFLIGAGAATGSVVLLDQLGVDADVEVPLLPLSQFGQVGTDAATLATFLGLLAVLRAMTGARYRSALLLSASAMLLAPVVAGQRAALLGLVVALLVALALAVRVGRSLRLPGGDLLVTSLLVLALLTTPPAVTAVLGKDLQLPLLATVSQAIDSRGKQLSAEGRVNQWREVRPLLAERPVLGWGLGKTYTYFEPGPRENVQTALTHNLAADVVLRTGVVGLALLIAALGATALAGLRAARRHRSALLVALAVGASSGFAGWLTKAMVESVFEKYRLAILLGLIVGVLLSLDRGSHAAGSLDRGDRRAEDTDDEPAPARFDEERTGTRR